MRILSIHPAVCVSACVGALIACGASTTDGTPQNTAGTGGASGSASVGTAGNGQGQSGGGGATSVAGSGGVVNIPGAGAGGAAGGTGGAAGGNVGVAGAGGSGGAQAGAGGSSGGAASTACGDPAPMPIAALIGAAPNRYDHTTGGRPAAVDLRAPIIMGKLIVDMGVDSGGIYDFGVDRGFHTYGGQIFHCEIDQGCPFPTGSGAHNSDCRWNTWDGMPHGDSNNVGPADSLSGKVQAALQDLSIQAPGEGWDYFLDTNGNVRWGDVGFTGYSHGAQTAALIGVKQCIYRAVSRSGPRDNGCGNGANQGGDYDPVAHAWPAAQYDPNCPDTCISDWIKETPASPMDVFYSFAGMTDTQFGDFQYTLDTLGGGFIGEPVNVGSSPPGDSHRFYANAGHGTFDEQQYWPALQKAWGVPDENMAYAAGL